MLAVLCTLGLVLLALCICGVVRDLFPLGGGSLDVDRGLLADERVEALNRDSLRKQIVSYGNPWLIDTLNAVYMVPVEIKTLGKPEGVERLEATTLSALEEPAFEEPSGSGLSFYLNKRGYYKNQYFAGDYANLILYKPLEEKTLPLFKERVFITDLNTFYFKDDILLLFYTASKDTNEDGIIDSDDFRKLCVYSLNTGVLRKISDGENHAFEYQFIRDSKDLLVRFKISRYKDKQFYGKQSPSKIMKYTYETQKLTEIISPDLQAEMQKLIEGK